MSSKLEVVAIDGPVGVGKSTVARRVAENLQFRHIDTGAMYRAVTWHVMNHYRDRIDDHDFVASIAREMDLELCDDGRVLLDSRDITHDIRDESVSRNVARVADIREVREALVDQQRKMGMQRPSVLEGRDIGTVVFPDAAYKFYLDASVDERVRRRAEQLLRMGHPVSRDTIRKNLEERDRRDRGRPWGSLAVADDAMVIDSTELDEDQVVEKICELVRLRRIQKNQNAVSK